MDSTVKSPVVLSLCPGIRGLERGIERALGAKLRVAAYVEIETFIVENLLAGMEAGLLDAAPIWTNLKTFDARPFRGVVEIILGGYPCQPFSTAGKRKGTADPRHLYPYISAITKIVQPPIVFFENVPGHITCGFKEVYADLRRLGYRVEAGIYSAEEVGAPHRRERLFILALGNTMRGRYGRSKEEICAGRNTVEPSKQGVAYSGLQRSTEQQIQPGGIKECSQLEYANFGRCETCVQEVRTEEFNCTGSDQMANTHSKRLRETRQCQDGVNITNQWPSRPGEPQQAWESPRVISREVESAVGLSAHGYNFREDFLRALGNSVVEQTAEIAFRDLIRKHGIEKVRGF